MLAVLFTPIFVVLLIISAKYFRIPFFPFTTMTFIPPDAAWMVEIYLLGLLVLIMLILVFYLNVISASRLPSIVR
jgi:hypothetical protein